MITMKTNMAAPMMTRHTLSRCVQKVFGFDVVIRICPGFIGIPGNLISYSTSHVSHSSDTSKKTYWDDFYARKVAANAKSFDWFFSHDVANHWLAKYICRGRTEERVGHVTSILELGCGTSTLASNLLKDNDNTMSLVSTDFSPGAVKQAQSISRKILSSKEPVYFVVADATRLPFRNNQFDVVFEKGTSDAMLNSNKCNLAQASFCEAVRVLTPRGAFLQFSDENPDLRLSFLEEALLKTDVARNCASVTFRDIGCSFGTEYFLYVIKLHRS